MKTTDRQRQMPHERALRGAPGAPAPIIVARAGLGRALVSGLRSCLARYYPGVLLLLAAAVLYLLTLQDALFPSQLQGGDLITHQYAQVQGRFSNAPGYPWYTMGGWLWFHLGRLLLGQGHNPVSILSSYSTLWALVALWCLYRLVLELTDHGGGGNQVMAVLAGAFYAVTYFFWYYAVTSEQYTSAVAWTLAVFWLVFRWERMRQDRYLLWTAFLAGAALAHMLTLPLVLPPLLVFVVTREPRLLRRPRLMAAALGLLALPLFSYAFVYVQGVLHPAWRGAGQWAGSWHWFLSFISTAQGRSELTWSWTPLLTRDFPSLIWRELTWPGLLLGLAGLALLPRPRALAIYAGLAIYVAFCWIDRQGNWFQVIMPAYALLAAGMAVVGDRLWRAAPWNELFERRGPAGVGANPGRRPSQTIWRGAIVLGLAVLVVYRGVASYPQANMRARAGANALAPGWAILADEPPPGAQVLATLPEDVALDYLTEVWGVRMDLSTVTAPQARALLERAAAAPETGQQRDQVASPAHAASLLARAATPILVVTSSFLPLVPAEVSAGAHYSALGRTLVTVRATPDQEIPASLASWHEDFGAGLRLAGGKVSANTATRETVVLLAWQALSAPPRDLAVSVRLTRGGTEIAQVDRAAPVDGAYPTSRWSAGEVVLDAYPFMLPAGPLPDGLTVILYYLGPDGSYTNVHIARLPLVN